LDLDVDENVLEARIHKLILQPLIENSIIHGFKGYDSERVLKVRINIFKNNYVKIIVKDNGLGIEDRKLQEIINNITSGKDEDENIGIKNVYDRIKIYYGEDAKFNIESVKGQGTTITLIISLIF
jgi:two-component system sensor histidine kinase YesM